MNSWTLIGLMVVMIGVMWWSGRSRRNQMAKAEEEKRRQLASVEPGAWVRTRVGFWGRFVDLDGDIVVLETTDGHEMYWERDMIAEIGGQPPLDADNQSADEADAPSVEEEDEAVLGLEADSSSTDTSDAEGDAEKK